MNLSRNIIVSKLIIFFVLFPVCVRGEIPTFESKSSHVLSNEVVSWTHEISLENDMEIYWNMNDPEWLTMEISAPTKGYVGVGFSPKGGMVGSDLVIGWVDDDTGTSHLQDYYALSNGQPFLDPSQDYELLLAMQTDNSTTIRFRRKWETCDEAHDMQLLGDDTVRLIWAWSMYDGQESLITTWHGPITRGTRSVFLKTVQSAIQFPDDVPGVQGWTVKVDNLHVPVKETVYHCSIFKLPHFDKKQHVIGYRPVFQKENLPYIHHATVYRCGVPPSIGDTEKIFEKYLNHPGADCITDEAPFDWIQYCYQLLLVIGIGTEGEMFPENVGIPFFSSENGEPNYIRFEIHYDNPGLHQIIDSSGMKIFHTEKLRDEELGVLFLGNKVTPFHVIPKNLERFSTFSFCSAGCTKDALPETGIKMTGVMLHGHVSATAVRLRHIRNGKELAPIAEDNNFDFNYQQFRTLQKEVRVLPGDELIVECDYNSLDHADTIIGGFPSRREMCQVLAWTYPKLETLTDCRTQIEFHSFFNALDIESKHIEDPLLTALHLPYVPENFTKLDWLLIPSDDSATMVALFPQYRTTDTNPWKHIKGIPIKKKKDKREKLSDKVSINNAILMKSSSPELAELLQNKWKNGSYYVYCTATKGHRTPNKEIIRAFPVFEPYTATDIENRKNHCKGISGSRGSTSDSNSNYHTPKMYSYIIAVIVFKTFIPTVRKLYVYRN